jgi:hypothetical protein
MERISKVEQRLNDQLVTSFYGKPEVYDTQTHNPINRGKELWFTKSGLILTKREKQVWLEISPTDHRKIFTYAKGVVENSFADKGEMLGIDREQLFNRIFREEMRLIRNLLYEEHRCGGCHSCS